jgi:hypothetical protein
MNDADALAPHAPDPRFAAHLEWQLRTELRRAGRFPEPVASAPGAGRAARVVATLLAAMAIGACGVLAAQEIRRSRAADLLVLQYQVRFEIARLREEAARAGVAELMKANEQGLVSPQEVYAAEERRVALAQEASVLGLDAIEAGHTGVEPDRRVSAALVAGRDLVTERLDQELSALGFRKSAAAERVKQLDALREAAGATEDELARARLEDARLAGEIASVQRKRELRADFLRGDLDAARADLLALREEAVARHDAAARELELAEKSAARQRALAAAGASAERAVRGGELELAARAAELRLAELELQIVDARLAD